MSLTDKVKFPITTVLIGESPTCVIESGLNDVRLWAWKADLE